MAPIHAHFRLERLDGERHAGAQTAAAQGHDHVGDVRHVFEDLKTDGALAAQHLIIIERGHVDHAFVVAQFLRVRCGFVEHLAAQHHVRAVRFSGIHLQRRSDLRHADGGLRATFTGRVRHTLRMVACGSGDDAMRKLLVRQRCDLVIRATNLERSGDLEILGLKQNLMSGHFGQHRRRNNLRVACGALQSFGGQFQFSGMIAPQCFEHLVLFHGRYCKRTSAEADAWYRHVGAGQTGGLAEREEHRKKVVKMPEWFRDEPLGHFCREL